jgi:hypothetical protein
MESVFALMVVLGLGEPATTIDHFKELSNCQATATAKGYVNAECRKVYLIPGRPTDLRCCRC